MTDARVQRILSRREWLRGILRVGGVTAAVTALDSLPLLAIPPAPNAAAGWAWDGSLADYLGHLVAQIDRRLGADLRRALSPFSNVEQIACAFTLCPEYRVDATRIGGGAPCVIRGQTAIFVPTDPIAKLSETAELFADTIRETPHLGYLDLELPKGVESVRKGAFRAIRGYDILSDRMLLRVDLALAAV